MNIRTWPIAITVAFLLAGAASAGVFPPFQMELESFQGEVKVLRPSAGGTPIARPGEERMTLLPGDRIETEKDSSASAVVSDYGRVLLWKNSEILVHAPASPGEPPRLELVKGGVMIVCKKGLSRKAVLTVEDGTCQGSGTFAAVYIPEKKGFYFAFAGDVTIDRRGKSKTLKQGERLFFTADSSALKTGDFPVDKMMEKWHEMVGKERVEAPVPVLDDRVPPGVFILAPKNNGVLQSATVELQARIDDPDVDEVRVELDGKFLKYEKVANGRMSTTLVLQTKKAQISVNAQDKAGNKAVETVVVTCLAPAVPRKEEPPKGFFARVKARIDQEIKQPSNPFTFVFVLIGGALLLGLLFFAIRKIWGLARKGAVQVAGAATGMVMHRCEKCDNREYHYHLFYTTETVTSPFMRNLINNVNPMATSLMNESLETILNTGLQYSEKAKVAEKKLRVACRWCDVCKTGTLSLEHLQGESVTKVDEYQIIHPIFIEWVRKVYD